MTPSAREGSLYLYFFGVAANQRQRRKAKRFQVLNQARGIEMLYTIALILLVLWVLGLVSSYTMGGLIHILLVVAVVVVLVRIIQGRRVL